MAIDQIGELEQTPPFWRVEYSIPGLDHTFQLRFYAPDSGPTPAQVAAFRANIAVYGQLLNAAGPCIAQLHNQSRAAAIDELGPGDSYIARVFPQDFSPEQAIESLRPSVIEIGPDARVAFGYDAEWEEEHGVWFVQTDGGTVDAYFE